MPAQLPFTPAESKKLVAKVVEGAEAYMGAQVPTVRVNSCLDCPVTWCAFLVGSNTWVVM